MPRIVPLIIMLIAIVGGLFALSKLVKQQPTHQIEIAVPQGPPAGGQEH
ncbi:MAG: hypothetical protein ABIW33_00665 [Sphingomicrobium sp.]